MKNKKPHEAAGFWQISFERKMLSRADPKLSDEGPFGHAAMHELVISGFALQQVPRAPRTIIREINSKKKSRTRESPA
jgi:hypothetical protein